MNTTENLLKEFGTQFPTLHEVSSRFFGWGDRVIRKHLAEGTFPIRTFKARPGRKSPWLIDVKDLAEYLESRQKSHQYVPSTSNHD